MNWTIEYLEDEGIVQVKTSGQMNWEDHRKLSEEALAIAREKNANMFLLDHQNLELKLSILEIDKLPTMLRELGVESGDKMAILYDQSSPNGRLFEFLQNVSYLSALKFRVFPQRDLAITWLKAG